MNQRWDRGSCSWRDGRIDPERHYVDEIPWLDARDFVVAHHYSRSFVAARERYGLFRIQSRAADELVGVAVFSQPVNAKSVTNHFGVGGGAVELGRFVLTDQVEGNGESWMLARCFDRLREKGYRGVLSFSDPTPRTTSDGRQVFPGHIGQIYQATNAVHAGRSWPQTLSLMPDGTCFTNDNKSKIRRLIQGWEYSARRLQEWGADAVWMDAPARWLNHWVGKICRPMRHPGNLRYLWGLDRRTRKSLPVSDPYPKKVA